MSRNKEHGIQKRENLPREGTERAEDRRVLQPAVDIVKTPDSLLLIADLPGAGEKSVEISLEKRVLTIHAGVTSNPPKGFRPIYAECCTGDYHRSFTLPEEVDCDGIRATVKNGELRLVLPKSKEEAARKIAVKAG